MSVTQNDIAVHLGVSRSMVARVLNDDPAYSLELRQRMQQAARELGYDTHGNIAARSLVAKRYGKKVRTGIIAVIWPHPEAAPLRSMPFYAPILDGIELESHARELDVFMCSLHHGRLPRLLREREVDGIITMMGEHSEIEQLRSLELPLVRAGVCTDEDDSIGPDDYQGMFLATWHLIELGHRHIGFIGHAPSFRASERRLAGYKGALSEAEIPVRQELIAADIVEPNRAGERGVAPLLEQSPPPTGLVCHNDLFAMAAVRWLEEQGRQVPGEMGVVGFDDVSVDYNFAPPLTSVQFDRQAMGRRAVELLCDRVKGEIAPREHILEEYPVRLEVRDSTAPPAVQP